LKIDCCCRHEEALCEKKTSTHRKFKVKHIDEPMAEWVKKERAVGRAVSRATIVRTATALNAQLN
jgi:hypothetical protein